MNFTDGDTLFCYSKKNYYFKIQNLIFKFFRLYGSIESHQLGCN